MAPGELLLCRHRPMIDEVEPLYLHLAAATRARPAEAKVAPEWSDSDDDSYAPDAAHSASPQHRVLRSAWGGGGLDAEPSPTRGAWTTRTTALDEPMDATPRAESKTTGGSRLPCAKPDTVRAKAQHSVKESAWTTEAPPAAPSAPSQPKLEHVVAVSAAAAAAAAPLMTVLDAGTGPDCLLYTSPSPRDGLLSRMPSSA